MSARSTVIARVTVDIAASEAAIDRALRSSHLWRRVARASGGRLEVAGNGLLLRPDGLLRYRPTRANRPLLFRVRRFGPRPELESVRPVLGCAFRLGFQLEPATAASADAAPAVRVTAEFVSRTGIAPRAALLRRSLLRRSCLRHGRMLLGIAALVAADPLRVVAGAVIEDGKVLLARRRPAPTSGAGPVTPAEQFWELPGGKVEIGESDRPALRRELLEELGLAVAVGERIGPIVQLGPSTELLCYRAWPTGGTGVALSDHDAVSWVGPEELDSYKLLEPDRELVESLRTALRKRN